MFVKVVEICWVNYKMTWTLDGRTDRQIDCKLHPVLSVVVVIEACWLVGEGGAIACMLHS